MPWFRKHLLKPSLCRTALNPLLNFDLHGRFCGISGKDGWRPGWTVSQLITNSTLGSPGNNNNSNNNKLQLSSYFFFFLFILFFSFYKDEVLSCINNNGLRLPAFPSREEVWSFSFYGGKHLKMPGSSIIITLVSDMERAMNSWSPVAASQYTR